MIKTARQLKDLIRNLSKDKSADAQILMRNYMMERFLERVSLSEYRDKFILKGGMLVAAMVGLDARSTMDIDATVKGATVGIEEVENMIASIISVPVDDGVEFRLKRISEIMDEAEYPGIRVSMETEFDGVITPLKIDISTGDAITPREVRYSFKLMLEDRSIEIWAYNLETVLAEKLETVVSRAITNTRMRDFYDLHILSQLHGQSIVPADLSVRHSSQQPESAAQRNTLPTHLRPLTKSKPARTWKSCGGLIRRSSPIPPICRGIQSWIPFAAFIGWCNSKRSAN